MWGAIVPEAAKWIIGVAQCPGVLVGKSAGDGVGDANRFIIDCKSRNDRAADAMRHDFASLELATIPFAAGFPVEASG